jgi:WD40 repeat protein/serine/threonine protein kinase
MATENFNEAGEIFQNAIEIEDPVERARYLENACKNAPKLRVEVEALLKAHEKVGDYLESPVVGENVTLNGLAQIEGPGTKIGHYELLELIGEGGMGLVYLAEQKEPVRRKVVLKIVKPGMDSKQVIARFEAERQALAVLDHPNIAHVFDAGATTTGRPYFVMEYVKGMSITRYCDDKKLSIEQRLRLFEQVCEGVHHAHQKGIIHRDLKPSNILVSVHGDRAVPKIIDFGIAKAITQPLTDKTFVTFQGQLLGTPEYMSPEQVDLATQDIDIRSDIYSLGVVLYELLAGVLPFEVESFARAGFAEIQRTIRESEPASPSIRLPSLGEKAKTIAASRGTQVVPLVRRLHRELEWIPLKAMRKDRCRRYRSAFEMADDIHNYLIGRPLIAGPETAIYRVQKFVRKHAGSVATVALVAIAIVLGLVVSTAMYFKAENAHQKEVVARAEAEDARENEATARLRAEEAEKVAEEKAESYRRLLYNYGVALADSKYREADIGGMLKILKDCPKDLRNWEWQRLDYLSDQSLMTLHGHGWGGVFAGACSPDGKFIASGGWDVTIRVWDLVSGEQLKPLRGHAEYISSLQFSPDSRYVASGSQDRTVRVWYVNSGEEVMILKGHDAGIKAIAFSPDGKLLASGGGANTSIKIWDLKYGKELISLRGNNDWISSIMFSPDGKHIVSASGNKGIKLWDITTGEFKTIYGGTYALRAAISPNGRHVVYGGMDGVLRFINVSDKSEFMALRGHTGIISCVAYSPDSKILISGGHDNTIRMWDAETGEELRVFRGHEKTVDFVSFTQDGSRIVSGSEDSTIKIWDPYTDYSKSVLFGPKNYVLGLAFTPDGKRIVSGSVDGTIRIWDADSEAEILTLHKHEDGLSSIALSQNGNLLASGGWNNTIKIWNLAGGEEIMTLQGHEGAIRSIAFSPDGKRIISGSEDQTVKVWDVVSGKELMTIRGHHSTVESIAISPDGKLIVSGGDGDIYVWDSITGDKIMPLPGHSQYVSCLTFSPNGQQIVSCSLDTTIRIWDVKTGVELKNLRGHSGYVTSAAFTQDGARLITSSLNGRIKVWDIITGQELIEMVGDTGIRSSALSPNERIFAAGCSDGSILLWHSSAPPEGYGPRQTTKKAREVVEQLHNEQAFYHRVIDKLNSDTTLTTQVRQVALQIARAHCWEDAEKLTKESRAVISSSVEETEKYQVALEQAKEANELEPNNSSVLNTLGIAQYRVGAFDKAIDSLVEAKNIRVANNTIADPANLAFLAMSYFKLGQMNNARVNIEHLRNLFEKGQYGNNYMARSVLIEAEELLAGENAEINDVWNEIKLGNINAAAQKIDTLRSLHKTNTAGIIEGAIKYLSRAYYQQGRKRLNIFSEYAAKIADYEAAVHTDPNHVASLNALAWLQSTCPLSELRNGNRAIELSSKACELTSWNNHDYITTLAAAYSETSDFDTAIKWQEKAASMLPEDCPTELRVNYEARLGVYRSKKPYSKGNLWSFSDGELVAHWKFDKADVPEVVDSSKNGLNGKFMGDAKIVSDSQRGNVLSLDGDNDYVEFKEDLAFDITGSITIAAWAKLNNFDIDNNYLLLDTGTLWLFRDSDKKGLHLTGAFTEATDLGVRWLDANGNIDVTDGKWHHIVGVHDGSKFSLYIDGILDDFQERGGFMLRNHSPIYIGGSPEESSSYWNGFIDDVRIYSYALNPEEVKMLYEGKEPPREKRSD